MKTGVSALLQLSFFPGILYLRNEIVLTEVWCCSLVLLLSPLCWYQEVCYKEYVVRGSLVWHTDLLYYKCSIYIQVRIVDIYIFLAKLADITVLFSFVQGFRSIEVSQSGEGVEGRHELRKLVSKHTIPKEEINFYFTFVTRSSSSFHCEDIKFIWLLTSFVISL